MRPAVLAVPAMAHLKKRSDYSYYSTRTRTRTQPARYSMVLYVCTVHQSSVRHDIIYWYSYSYVMTAQYIFDIFSTVLYDLVESTPPMGIRIIFWNSSVNVVWMRHLDVVD